MAHYSTDDPYTDPSTGVLSNLLGIADQNALDAAEADIVSARLVELAALPISGNFDVPHLKALHRHLFSDIYEWAGSFRTIGELAQKKKGEGSQLPVTERFAPSNCIKWYSTLMPAHGGVMTGDGKTSLEG